MNDANTGHDIATGPTPKPSPPDPPAPAVRSGRRTVPIWLFVGAVTAALIMFVLWMAARSDLDEANGQLSEIQAAKAALPDLQELGEAHLGGLGVLDDSGEEHLSATFVGARGLTELEDLLEDLDFSPAVSDRIGRTRALDGTQSADAPHVTATWTYHPDHGLSIVFERDDR